MTTTHKKAFLPQLLYNYSTTQKNYLGNSNNAQGKKTTYQASFSCLKPFLVNKPLIKGILL
jgi:hypothetical protein